MIENDLKKKKKQYTGRRNKSRSMHERNPTRYVEENSREMNEFSIRQFERSRLISQFENEILDR